MENAFDEVSRAVRAAREVNRAVDGQADSLADLLDGRLTHVCESRLKRLKAQLRNFNAQTGKWKG